MLKFSQKSVAGKVYKTITEHHLIEKGDSIVVAVSGGPDSVALLLILEELKETLGFSLSACHFNHRLRGEESDRDEAFVRKLCQKKNIECFSGQAKRKNEYKNEEEARDARYSFFKKILEEGSGDKVAIAHNQNDLAETVLLRLIRGSGLRGLRSIPYSREKIIRPVLDLTRAEIETYLRQKRQKFCIDATNFDCSYLRNKIRHNIMPKLSEINPNLIGTLAQTAVSVTLDYDLIEELAGVTLKKVLISLNNDSMVLDHKKWASLHPALKAETIRAAIRKIDTLTDISAVQIQEILEILDRNVGRKSKLLPRSLRVSLLDGKIVMSKYNNSKENR